MKHFFWKYHWDIYPVDFELKFWSSAFLVFVFLMMSTSVSRSIVFLFQAIFYCIRSAKFDDFFPLINLVSILKNQKTVVDILCVTNKIGLAINAVGKF